jgi:hypothetical protein
MRRQRCGPAAFKQLNLQIVRCARSWTGVLSKQPVRSQVNRRAIPVAKGARGVSLAFRQSLQ